jgi:hypothetical protein
MATALAAHKGLIDFDNTAELFNGLLGECGPEGWVGIIVSPEDGGSTRVRSLGPHTTIGEMGLITGRSRSATIQAEVDQRALYPGHRRL